MCLVARKIGGDKHADVNLFAANSRNPPWIESMTFNWVLNQSNEHIICYSLICERAVYDGNMEFMCVSFGDYPPQNKCYAPENYFGNYTH